MRRRAVIFFSGSWISEATPVTRRLEGVGPADREEAAAVAVGIDVRDALRPELFPVELGPLGRAEQPLLLAVPRAQENRALGPPALLEHRSVRAGLFEHRHEARDRILGPVDPGIVVIAPDDPLVGPDAARDSCDDVARGNELPVEDELEVDLRGPRADPVGDRERAAPALRRDRALEGREQRLRVAVADRKDRDLRQGRRVLPLEAARVLRRAHAGRERVAGVDGHVRDAAALDALLRPEGALRVDLALEEPVVLRVGVDDASDGALLRGDLGLDAPPSAAVAGDDDLPLHVDAEALETLVVFRDAVVHVDERRGDVAVDRVGVVASEAARPSGRWSGLP